MNNPSYQDDSDRNPPSAELQLQPAAESPDGHIDASQAVEEENSGFVLGYN
jgi:hypothetical protein